jgi:hypothetical protein
MVKQRRCTGVVADLSGGHEEAERAAVCVGHGMELRVLTAFSATDQAPEIPFLTRRLDAVRSALRYVASIMTVLGSASAATSPSIMRRNTPISPHRFSECKAFFSDPCPARSRDHAFSSRNAATSKLADTPLGEQVSGGRGPRLTRRRHSFSVIGYGS